MSTRRRNRQRYETDRCVHRFRTHAKTNQFYDAFGRLLGFCRIVVCRKCGETVRVPFEVCTGTNWDTFLENIVVDSPAISRVDPVTEIVQEETLVLAT